jgi:cyclopropane-fatty-acyl-phospholipid synthase
MNTLALHSTNEFSRSARSSRRAGFFEKRVLKALGRFRIGALCLRMPDGVEHRLGDPLGPVTAEIRLLDAQAFFKHCALYGNVGFGESYVAGDWETDDVCAVIRWFIQNLAAMEQTRASSSRIPGLNYLRSWNRLLHKLRPNSVKTSRRNISEHYDLGNDFYSLWLDQTMTYSSARFTEPNQSLEDAQWQKYEALCQKLQLRSTDHVLEIGCGWGGFCTHAAREHGCRLTSITISQEQYDYAKARVEREGLAHLIEIRLQDYRHVQGQFDKIASIEMLEAVGDAFVDTYFAKCHELLKPDGMLAFQVITVPDSRYDDLKRGVDWIQKHIFPGSLLLSLKRINQAINRSGDLFMHGFEDLGASYAKTLRVWFERFNARAQDVMQQGFDELFMRKWNFYLQYCEAAFATRNISVVQMVYTRPNNPTLHREW